VFDGTKNIAFQVEQAVFTGNDHIALMTGGAGHVNELHIKVFKDRPVIITV